MADARAWAGDHAADLRGTAAESAANRIREAGLTPRVVDPGAVITLEYRPDRITLEQDADGVVTAVRPG